VLHREVGVSTCIRTDIESATNTRGSNDIKLRVRVSCSNSDVAANGAATAIDHHGTSYPKFGSRRCGANTQVANGRNPLGVGIMDDS